MRPSKLNEQLIWDMCDKIRDGLPVNYTCDLFGVTQMCFMAWMRAGEEDLKNGIEDSIHVLLYLMIKKAHAEYVEKAKNTMQMLPKNWQAIAWWLERTDRNFMPKQQIEANTEDGKVTVVLGGKIKEASKNLLEHKSKDEDNK